MACQDRPSTQQMMLSRGKSISLSRDSQVESTYATRCSTDSGLSSYMWCTFWIPIFGTLGTTFVGWFLTVKDFTTLHMRILSSSKGWRWFWMTLWGKNGPKNIGRVFTKVAKGELETNTTNSLALMAIGFGPFQIHDNWESTINNRTLLEAWPGNCWYCRRTRWLKLPKLALSSRCSFSSRTMATSECFFSSIQSGSGVVVGPIMFNLINHSMTNTGMILDKYMQMIRIDMTWLRENMQGCSI